MITVYDDVVYATSDISHSQPYYNLAGPGYSFDNAINGGAARIKHIGNSFSVVSGFENHPVTYVSWYGATAFCNFYGYRLPTEWEWQAVADYDGTFVYGCGTTIVNTIANYIGSTHPNGTTSVDTFNAYGYGVCDMAGNVWEWTMDCYYPDCSSGYRSVRGGSWGHYSDNCNVTQRNYHEVNGMDSRVGFRVCLDMAFILGGEFQMGNSISGEGNSNELPVYSVTLSPFYMGKYLITNGQYCNYLNLAYSTGQIKVVNGVVYAVSDASNSYPYCDTYLSPSSESESEIDFDGSSFSVRNKGGLSMVNYSMVHISWYGMVPTGGRRSDRNHMIHVKSLFI